MSNNPERAIDPIHIAGDFEVKIIEAVALASPGARREAVMQAVRTMLVH
jgi:hypothetical protein